MATANLFVRAKTLKTARNPAKCTYAFKCVFAHTLKPYYLYIACLLYELQFAVHFGTCLKEELNCLTDERRKTDNLYMYA